MRVTLLGHASLLVEGGGVNVLMDPVFYDPIEPTTASCPARVVNVERLPRIDAVVLSHGHQDHFHLRSLRRLARSTAMYFPEGFMDGVLGTEGFTERHIVSPWQVVQVGELRIHIVPSLEEGEHGALFVDADAAVWNLVDGIAAHPQCAEVHARAGGIVDVAFCPYNPLLEHAETWVHEVDFPHARFERLLEQALAVQARTVVPGSSGERLAGAQEWLNHRIFPVTRQRFAAALRDVAPELLVQVLDPGQAVVVTKHEPSFVESTPYAGIMSDDTARIAFAPEDNPAPPFVDLGGRSYADADLAATVELTVQKLRQRTLAKLRPDLEGPLRTLWDRRAVVQLDLVGPLSTWSFHLARWTPEPRWDEGPHPDPDYLFRYLATELHAFVAGHRHKPPRFQAERRRATPGAAGERFRFSALDPARLHGEDAYIAVDAEYLWSPLGILLEPE